MSFYSPFLPLLVCALLLVFYLLSLFLKGKKIKSPLVFWSLKAYGGSYYRALRLLQSLLFVAAFVFLLLALARPRVKKLETDKSKKGVDIIFVLDISDSMLIEDMRPHENRLESAKHHIEEFIKNRDSDPMSLVVFSGEAYTRIPLTLDYSLLTENLSSLQVSEKLNKGTAIGVALAAGVNRARMRDTKSKVIILLTDGENNTGIIDPLTALDLAVEEGVKVYTIGIGRDGQSMLPVFTKDIYGRKIKSYRPFPTKINEKLLKEMADRTSGQFYRASEEQDMSRIFQDIDRLEKTEIKGPKKFKYVEKFQWPLGISLLFWLLLFVFELAFFWRGL